MILKSFAVVCDAPGCTNRHDFETFAATTAAQAAYRAASYGFGRVVYSRANGTTYFKWYCLECGRKLAMGKRWVARIEGAMRAHQEACAARSVSIWSLPVSKREEGM